MKYVRVWEAARREQYVLRYKLEMDELKEILNDHCVRERNENHVNDVLMRYLTRRIAVSELLPNFSRTNENVSWIART